MDKYRIRRAILDAIEDQEPGPTTLADLDTHPTLKRAGMTPERLVTEIQGLVDHGYLDDKRPGREPLLLLTAKGRDQLNLEADLDEYVWDKQASKFQR